MLQHSSSEKNLPEALYTAEQVRRLDAIAIELMGHGGYELMQRAGRSVFRQIVKHWPEVKSLSVFCGGGNNGGDGYVVADLAIRHGITVQVYTLSDPKKLTGEAAEAYQSFLAHKVAPRDWQRDSKIEGEIIVDALLGTGLSGPVREDYAAAIVRINEASGSKVSVDIPSGLCADTGMPLGPTINAEFTCTFIGLKQGLLTGLAPDYSGDIYFDDLDIPLEAYEQVAAESYQVNFTAARKWLPPRNRCAHKGDYGRVLVVGGDKGYGGAALMAAEAAYKVGAGLVACATHPHHVSAGLSRSPEVMFRGLENREELQSLINFAEVIAIGPGLGLSPWGQMCLATCLGSEKPLILDADALNLIAGMEEVPDLFPHAVITPHPGEAARLLKCDTGEVTHNRFQAAQGLAKKYNCVCLLKGAGTVIAAPDLTEPKALSVVIEGNPGMAVGGMGDVLTGMIAGLVGQGVTPKHAAELAAAWHGKTAEYAVKQVSEVSLTATDVLMQLGPTLLLEQ